MKITGVSVSPVALTGDGEAGCLVRLTTDSGLDGHGMGLQCDVGLAESMAVELLVGSDPRAAVALWQALFRRAAEQGGSMSSLCSAAALDMAVWDLKSKARGEPLWRTLGGSQQAIRVCVRLSVHEDGIPASVLDERVRRPGFEAGLLDGLTGSESDLEAAASLFEALAENGPNPELVLDLGDACGPKVAQEFIGRCESRFDVTRVQISGHGWSASEFRQLSNHVGAAISRADKLANPDSFYPPLQQFSTDVIVIDPAVRGVSGALHLADAAYGYELPVVLAATPGNFGAHLASVMPTFMAMEIGDPQATPDGLSTGMYIDGGRVLAGDLPGHGLGWEGPPPPAAGEG